MIKSERRAWAWALALTLVLWGCGEKKGASTAVDVGADALKGDTNEADTSPGTPLLRTAVST